MNFPYEDIVNLPCPRSARHAPMPDADRAAQFSPFAALTGHDEAIRETARLTNCRAELDEDEKARLNDKLQKIARHLQEKPVVSLTCFFEDLRKTGGAYVTVTGMIKRIDVTEQRILMETGEVLRMEDLYGIAWG